MPVEGNVAAGPRTALTDVAGDFGELRYRFQDAHHAFIFPGDVQAGATVERWVQLPQLAAPTDVRSVDMTALDDKKPWESIKVYDTGECSDALLWGGFGIVLYGELQSQIQPDEGEEGAEGIEGGDLEAFRLRPVIRSEPSEDASVVPLPVDADFFRLDVVFSGDRFFSSGRKIDCDGARVTLSMDIAIGLTNGVAQHEPGCFGPAGGHLTILDGQHHDLTVTADVVQLDVKSLADPRSNCGAAARSKVGDKVKETFLRTFTGTWSGAALHGDAFSALAQELTERLLMRDPRDFGLEPRSCSCQGECTEFHPAGAPYASRRAACNFETNECEVLLEPDRVNFRPKRLEVVLAQDATTDVQAARYGDSSLSDQCDRMRWVPRPGFPLSQESLNFSLSSFTRGERSLLPPAP